MKIYSVILIYILAYSLYGDLAKECEYKGSTLQKQGESIFTHYGFKVYQVAYYSLQAPQSFKDSNTDSISVLVLQYSRDLKRSDIIKNAQHILEKNPDIDLSDHENKLDQLHRLYSNVNKGDRYKLAYHPNDGLELYLNNELQGEPIIGYEFKKAYFSIWLSQDHSVSKSLTKKILNL